MNSNRPQGVLKAVFWRSSGRMSTAWNAPAPSMALKTLQWARRLKLSLMRGSGVASFRVILLRGL